MLAVLIFAFVALALLLIVLCMGRWRAVRREADPLESGMVPVGDARDHFPVKFRLVALVFMVVEAGAILLYPWAVALRDLLAQGDEALVPMTFFIAIVALALVYAGRKGGLTPE